MALHAINVFLATTILPSVIADIGGTELYAWATTVFVFASVLGSTIASAVLGARGPRASYRMAALILGIGTVICALAPTMPVLLIGRLVQGIGGGLLFALCYSMIRISFHEALWPRAMALVSAMWGVATLVGPAIGGVFAELNAWRWSFWILIPIVILFGTWGASRLPAGAYDGTASRIPWVSVGLLAVAVLVISAASISSLLSINVAGLVVAMLLLFAWLNHERKATRRLLPAAAFGPNPRLRLVYLTMSLLVIASTVEVFVPYFGQRLQGLGPLAAGYLGAVMAAGWTAGSILCSGIENRRLLIVAIAPAFSALGLMVLIFTGPVHSGGALAIGGIAIGLLLLGWGVGMAWPHLTTMVLQFVPDEDQGLAGSSVTTVQLTATAFGSAIAGAITNVAGFADTNSIVGVQTAAQWLFGIFTLAALIALATAILTARSTRH
ncbi:MFS transporter [Arthrobacter glacialis]|uniref:MFS transporter n=1 Tax=Arthrobacter glacialis TaxID=1664 RepID=UPI001A9CA79C|nr:MFS transporter [Arthrobacter glacialis]